MKTVEKMAAQGDVLFQRIDEIPKGAKVEKASGKIVVAHSETGHHHAIERRLGVVHFRSADPLVSYLDVPKHADVVHLRVFDTHETLRLTKGKWAVRRQREMTPEGWRRVED